MSIRMSRKKKIFFFWYIESSKKKKADCYVYTIILTAATDRCFIFKKIGVSTIAASKKQIHILSKKKKIIIIITY